VSAGEAIFRAVCDAPSVKLAVTQLGAAQLAVLLEFLKGSASGVRCLVLAEAQADAAERFTHAHLIK
jgi:hypothetical protein